MSIHLKRFIAFLVLAIACVVGLIAMGGAERSSPMVQLEKDEYTAVITKGIDADRLAAQVEALTERVAALERDARDAEAAVGALEDLNRSLRERAEAAERALEEVPAAEAPRQDPKRYSVGAGYMFLSPSLHIVTVDASVSLLGGRAEPWLSLSVALDGSCAGAGAGLRLRF